MADVNTDFGPTSYNFSRYATARAVEYSPFHSVDRYFVFDFCFLHDFKPLNCELRIITYIHNILFSILCFVVAAAVAGSCKRTILCL